MIPNIFNKIFGREIRNKQYELTDTGIFLPKSKVNIGGSFGIEVIRDGDSLGVEHSHNIVIDNGLNHILDTILLAGVGQVAAWYIGLGGTSYTPLATDDAASLPGNMGEAAATYNEANRVLYNGVADTGAKKVTNTAIPADFTITAPFTAYSAMLTSNATKGATTGTVLSAAEFSPSRAVIAADVLRVTYEIEAASS